MTQIDDDTRRRAERARRVGLFRYELIQEVIDPALSTRARGRLVRALAEREHTGPFGAPVRVSRHTIDRWARDWRSGGFEALVPRPARVTPRIPAEVLEVATALKRENPTRTAAQVARILRAQSGGRPRNEPCNATSSGWPCSTASPVTTAATVRRRRRCSAGSRPIGATSCGSVTPCTAHTSAAARPICSPSSTTGPAR